MDIHASPASLPELDEFLATFQVRFRRPECQAALERYLTGLLTELPNKNWGSHRTWGRRERHRRARHDSRGAERSD